MDLREPKRKRVGPHIKPQQALPIPIQNESGFPPTESLLPLYIGNYTGDCVVVYNTEEMMSLYKMGFFGKGSFSRGYPSFGQSKKGIPVAIKERQWKRRKLWADTIKDTLSQTLKENTQIDGLINPLDSVNPQYPLNGPEVPKTTEIKVNNKKSCNEHNHNENINKNFNSFAHKEKQNTEELANSGNGTKSSSKVCNSIDTPDIEIPTNCSIFNDANKIFNSVNDIKDKNSMNEVYMYQSHLLSPEASNSEVLVLADSDDENLENILEDPQPHLENEEVKTVVETLNLTLEEAFFLSFGLGCLQINDILGQEMSLTQQWQTFIEVKSNFIESYVCYHHFRAKGWVVKSGYKFGGDFLLYKQGPPFYHASYIVLVEKVDSQLRGSGHNKTWTQFHGLNRLAENSGKDVIICQVVFPSDMPKKSLYLSKLLSKFQINEKLIKRWLPSQERIEKDA